MENHLPEYEYTMVVHDDGEEVPGILFDGACYELELITASDVSDIVKCLRMEKRFSDYAARINKVCRGTASCQGVPMDRSL